MEKSEKIDNIIVKCGDDIKTIQRREGQSDLGVLAEVEDAIISLYEESEVEFQEFLEAGRLELVGLPLCLQVIAFAELKEQLDGDEVSIQGCDGAYPRMDLAAYLTGGPAPVKKGENL